MPSTVATFQHAQAPVDPSDEPVQHATGTSDRSGRLATFVHQHF